MAILTSADLTDVRRLIDRARSVAINYTKPQANAAIQAVEDWFEDNRAALSAAIDAATEPLGITLTNPQKREFVKQWLTDKFQRGG